MESCFSVMIPHLLTSLSLLGYNLMDNPEDLLEK